MKWKNRATYEVFRYVLHDWGTALPELIAEWRKEIPDGDFVPEFAARLKEDLGDHNHWDPQDPNSRLTAEACRMLLARVDWRQVAERLTERAQRTGEEHTDLIPDFCLPTDYSTKGENHA